MHLPDNNLVRELLTVTQGPCISLYMPAHRQHPDNAQDPIRFKNILAELGTRISASYGRESSEELLKPFAALATDQHFWNHTSEGLAFFCTRGFFRVTALPVPVRELVVVSESFHTKPLRHYLQSQTYFQVLGLSLEDMQLYEGNNYGLHAVQLPDDFPSTLVKALGSELTEKHMTVASYGGVNGVAQMRHGHGDKKDEVDKDSERFFKIVSDAVYNNYSKQSGLPLVLAALPEHHNMFQKASNNPFLLPQGIALNYKAVPLNELAAMAWEILAPSHAKKIADLAEKFGHARAHGTGSEILSKVAEAAVAGRVDTLLVEADRFIPGKIADHGTGRIEAGASSPFEDDLLDDIAETVTRKGGRVLVLPASSMPGTTGLAAIFRY